MSTNPIQTMVVDQFRTVNVTSLPFRLKKDEVAFAVNVDFKDDLTIQQRPGSEIVANIGAGVSLFKFSEIRNGVVTDHLVALGEDKAYRFNGTGFDVIASGMTPSARWGGCGYIGKFLFSNQYETKVFKFDTDAQAYTVADVAGDYVPHAVLWAEYQGRLWAAGDNTENLYFSGDDTTLDAEVWDANNFIALGSIPTSLKATGEFLFIGTDRGLYKITSTGDSSSPFTITCLVSIGVAPNTLLEISAGIISCWLVNGQYVVFNQYAQTGSQINVSKGIEIASAIKASDLTNTEICSAVTDDGALYSMHVSFPVEGQSYLFSGVKNNIQYALNAKTYGWSFYNLEIKSMVTFNGSMYFSDFDGNIHRFDKKLFTDNGLDFESKVISAVYDFGRGDLQKGYRKLWLSANSNTKTQIRVSFAVDYSMLTSHYEDNIFYSYGGMWGSSKWGEFIWGGILKQESTIDLDSYGRGIQFIFEKSFENADMQIKSFLFTYLISYQEVM